MIFFLKQGRLWLSIGQKNPTAIQSYISISEKNIFNPERKEFPILGAGADARKPTARPHIVLYGVTIAADYQAASLVNPGGPLKKGEREQMTFKLGEQVGDYKLAKILSDRITLEGEGDSFEVLLYDPKMPKRRRDVRTENRPAAVTSTQPAPASGTARAPLPPAGAGAPGPATSPPASLGASKPAAPGGQVAAPPPSIPARPTVPSPDMRRGRRPVYPPTPPTPTQDMSST